MSRSARRLVLLGLGAWIAGACTSGQPPVSESVLRAGVERAADGGSGPGDIVQFVIDPVAYLTPGTEQLALLTTRQPICSDGTIQIPYVGPVRAENLTEHELSALVSRELRTRVAFEGDLQARIIPAR